MSSSYPQKQTIIIASVCFVLVGITAFYVHTQAPQGTNTQITVTPEQNSIENTQQSISTSTDWKKNFFGATSSSAISNIQQSKAQAPEELTSTDVLGRNFFTQYVQLKQAGLTTDKSSVDAANNQVISQSLSAVSAPKVYKMSDIRISSSTSIVDSAKLYSANLMKILNKDMPAQNEAEIADKAYSSGDLSQLQQIDPIILGYQNGITDLIQTPVPPTLAQYHLNLINGLSIQAYNAQSLRKSDVDPLKGLVALSLEIKGLGSISEAIGSMQNYFKVAGIPFDSAPSGSILQSK